MIAGERECGPVSFDLLKNLVVLILKFIPSYREKERKSERAFVARTNPKYTAHKEDTRLGAGDGREGGEEG